VKSRDKRRRFKSCIACVVLALAAAGCSRPQAPASQPADASVDSYFAARDNFIRTFETASGPTDDRPALADLERQVAGVIGPVRVEGFPGPGHINLETLHKELGFGQVDGLAFVAGDERLFVTTGAILERYVAENPRLPGDMPGLSRNGEFFSRVFSSGAAVTRYADVPVSASNPASQVGAFLGLTAQDIGPFVPADLFVFMAAGNRMLAVHAPARARVTDIPSCRSEWEAFDSKRREAFDRYRASDLEDKQAFEDSRRYDEQGFQAYQQCFDREARDQSWFGPLVQQAQSIIDRLQAAGLEGGASPR
jgi:hypothetical protein